MEDLTTSVDYQGVFSKVTCKVGSLNVKHFLERLVIFFPALMFDVGNLKVEFYFSYEKNNQNLNTFELCK